MFDFKLILRVVSVIPAAVTKNMLSIAACKSLKALTLRHFNTSSAAMLSFIEEISSSSLQELNLVIAHIGDLRLEKMHAVGLLAAGLVDRRLDGLEDLRCFYSGPLNEFDVLEYLRAELAVVPLRVRNNIRVTVVRDNT